MIRVASAVFFTALLGTTSAFADVSITPIALHDYALPGAFSPDGALFDAAPNGTTVIANTTGEGTDTRCSVVVATDAEARVYRYAVDDSATQCIGLRANPDGGFFLRTRNPQAMPGDVTGATAYIDDAGIERWKIRDSQLVDADPRPAGTGSFLGEYLTAYDTLIYSPQTDRLIAYTIGKLTVGVDEKYIAQAHVVVGQTGELLRSGQSIGPLGIGIPVATTVRPDGTFVVAFDTLGLQGLVFYTYDGRETVEELRPLEQGWEERYLSSMFWAGGTLSLLWFDPNDAAQTTEFATTNAAGRELARQSLDATYRFADGQFAVLGPPVAAWKEPTYFVILHAVDGASYLRFVDENGESPGAARLNGVVPQAPVRILATEDGLKLLAFDSVNPRIYEYALTFMDAPDYNPDMGLADVDLPDVGLEDVLREVGCGCVTQNTRVPATWMLAWAALGLGLMWRRR